MTRIPPGLAAMIEVGILFLPAIPAYVWLWPNLEGTAADLVQALAYLYVLVGCVVIGRRRWDWSELGINRRGIPLSLACGAVLIGEGVLARLALGFPLAWRPLSPFRLAGEVLFYFCLVGLAEELLFRGLIYRALADWVGPGCAILGSALGFGLWHVGWAGSLALGHVAVGLLFGLVRWRAGGIVGLIVIHALMDLIAIQWDPPMAIGGWREIGHIDPHLALAGDVILLVLIVYLWMIHPRLHR